MYRQSAFGRVPPRRQDGISVPENYSGNAFREQAETVIAEEEAEAASAIEDALHDEEKNIAEPRSFLSGITEKLGGDSLLLLLCMFIVLGGGGEKDDGSLLSLLILLLI